MASGKVYRISTIALKSLCFLPCKHQCYEVCGDLNGSRVKENKDDLGYMFKERIAFQ